MNRANTISASHKAARLSRQSKAALKRFSLRFESLTRTLHERSLDLAASRRRLKEEIQQRGLVEKLLEQNQTHYGLLLEQSRQMQEKLRLLSRQLLLAQEEERKKISRELHDVIAQSLTSINVRLASLRKEASVNTNGIERSIARAQLLVERSVKTIHTFARELRPTALDDLGLIPALHSHLKRFRTQTGILVSLSAPAALDESNIDTRTVLYRIAQEALTNVAKHARATRAEVKVQILDGMISMRIQDNGKGFPPERPGKASLRADGKRLGILGMKERSEMVGGHLSVSSSAGKGTTVLAQIPLTGAFFGRGHGKAVFTPPHSHGARNLT